MVLVGSMRPATATSADGPLNLYNAVAVAADPGARGRGVLVVSNDDLFAARDIQKTNTTDVADLHLARTAASSARRYYGKAWYFRKPTTVHTTSERVLPRRRDRCRGSTSSTPTRTSDGTMVEAAVAAGAKGIVLAGVGDGNMTAPMIDALAAAAAKGVVVVRSTRVGSGIVRRNIEVNDDKLGFVAAHGAQPAEGAGPAPPGADQDQRRQADPGLLRPLLKREAARPALLTIRRPRVTAAVTSSPRGPARVGCRDAGDTPPPTCSPPV